MEDYDPIVNAFCEGPDAGERALGWLMPVDVQCIRALIPQFKALQGKEVVLGLGFCPLRDQVEDVRTLDIVGSIREMFPTLFIDDRKECWRTAASKDKHERCRDIGKDEAEPLIQATAMELHIATRVYGIKIVGCFAFSACWKHGYAELCEHLPWLNEVPYHWEYKHIGWLMSTGLRDFAQSLCEKGVLPSTVDPAVLFSKMARASGMTDTPKVMFQPGSAARFRERFGDTTGPMTPVPEPVLVLPPKPVLAPVSSRTLEVVPKLSLIPVSYTHLTLPTKRIV